ncbi:MAG: T9SS type A sorting domain-containing protein [Ignavibacteriales bacterium]|nr:T9SS type A sorting domain-containing protein [Ignavibacteriales bacterium]
MIKSLFSFCLVITIVVAGTKNTRSPVVHKSSVLFEQRLSQISNNEFYITNYGVYGHNVSSAGAGWFWPRGSARAYIYGQSIWFGAKKRNLYDTVKVVSVGYNPNSGASWFAPGSVVDGMRVLPDTDPRAKKYYMYVGTDFSSEGKNTKNGSLPDWPLRWKNSSKQPGKDGYYGDYLSDSTERAQYPPVFISDEDMFCIYKDTDTLRNPEYKPNTGYPLGLDIQQTVYSWGSGPSKDFVYLIYNVINKSGDTLRECYLAPAGDSDIGSSTNDHNSFYSNDSILNLAFQFTENEGGYIGVIGFDFLESPVVKTSADSLLIFQRTGRAKNVGSQIGLTTFRNWGIDNDPPNGPARYDFMAAGVRDGDTGPGDKRLLMATGPFTMAPNDTARVVVCVLVAPGKGNPISGDVQTNGYLDSLVALDKYAQLVYDNDFQIPMYVQDETLAPKVFSLAQNYPNPFNPETEIRFTTGVSSHVSLKVYNVLGQLVATLKNEYLKAGEYSVQWNAQTLTGSHAASGMYVYRLEAGSLVESKKMILLR